MAFTIGSVNNKGRVKGGIKLKYNKDRKGWETKDGGLIRVHDAGVGKVRIDIYDGNERLKNSHTRDTIHHDTSSGTGRIDSHNEDKSVKSSIDTSCFLTTACMKNQLVNFDDNCHELETLRWFREKFVSKHDVDYYYKIAPIIIEGIESNSNKDSIYKYIYDNIINYCLLAIEEFNYELAYKRYLTMMLILEETYGQKQLEKRLVKILKKAL